MNVTDIYLFKILYLVLEYLFQLFLILWVIFPKVSSWKQSALVIKPNILIMCSFIKFLFEQLLWGGALDNSIYIRILVELALGGTLRFSFQIHCLHVGSLYCCLLWFLELRPCFLISN